MKRKASRNTHRFATTLTAVVATCWLTSVVRAASGNVILIVADGLGPSHYRLAAEYSKVAYDEPLQNTDIVAADTTHLVSGEVSFKGLLATAASKGYKTALITTEDVVSDICRFYGVAPQADKPGPADVENILNVKADIVLGGGLGLFIQKSKPDSLREDELDMLVEARAAGWKTLTKPEELFELKPGGKALGLFSAKGLANAVDKNPMRQPALFEMVDVVANNLGSGYFIIIHNSNLAKACKDKDPASVVEEIRDLDAVITYARDHTKEKKDTLVLLVATPASLNPTTRGGNLADGLFFLKSMPMSLSKGVKNAAEIGFDKLLEDHFTNVKLNEDRVRAGMEDQAKVRDILTSALEEMSGVSWERNESAGIMVWGFGPRWESLKNLNDMASIELELTR